MIDIVIRKIKIDELYIMEDLLYEAIFQPDDKYLPKEIVYDPTVFKYINGFGTQYGDNCLVATVQDRIVGGVWSRILNGKDKGYGYIDSQTPELASSLFNEWRGKGIGTKLMINMITHLKHDGYTKVSLSVNKSNYAYQMYLKLGFQVIQAREEDYLMSLVL